MRRFSSGSAKPKNQLSQYLLYTSISALTGVGVLTAVTYEYPQAKKQLLDLNFYPPSILDRQHQAYSLAKNGFYRLAGLEPYQAQQEVKKPSLNKAAAQKQVELPVQKPIAQQNKHVPKKVQEINSFQDVEQFVRQLGSQADQAYVSLHLERISQWLDNESARLKEAVKPDLEGRLSQDEVDKQLKDLKQRLARRSDQERRDLDTFYKEVLRLRLVDQEQELKQKFEVEMQRKIKDLQMQQAQKIRYMLDTEREGRLAKLDLLAVKLSNLEQSTKDSVAQNFQLKKTVEAVLDFDRLALSLNQAQKRVVEYFSQESQDQFVKVLSKSTLPVLKNGVPDDTELQHRFHQVAKEVHRYQYATLSGGAPSLALSYFLSLFTFKKRAYPSAELGSDVDSVLQRTTRSLANGDYINVVAQLQLLEEWPAELVEQINEEMKRAARVKMYLEAMEAHNALALLK